MSKKNKEEWKTYQNVFDNFTYRVLDKMIAQGHINGLVGPLSIGKEANVFTAENNEGLIAVKIYRLETCDFNRMYEYIFYDPRFIGLKKQRRKVIFEWVKREYRNIMKSRVIGLNVPKPITFNSNVLIEEFIGDSEAAPKLKDKIPEDPDQFFAEILKSMKMLYDAGYVHADLSHFNILNDNETPVLIDFSTMTERGDPNFEHYLVRDYKNICNFGNKCGLKLDYKDELQKIRKK